MLKAPGAGQTPEVQAQMAGDVNERLSNAVDSLKARYAAGKGGFSSGNNVEEGPSGSAYKDEAAQKRADKRAEKAEIQAQQDADDASEAEKRFGEVGSDDEEGADDDNELRQLRVRRMKEMKRRAEQKLEHIGKGHGQLRDILEDEFLKEVTGSDRVICHFYHGDFPRCAIMDMHLLKLAKRHIETKFIKIDAAKAPFFVNKLSIRMMPTLVQFVDGNCRGKQVGFEGMADDMPDGHEDEFPTIKLARILADNNMIDKSAVVDEDGIEAAQKAKMAQMRQGQYVNMPSSVFDLDCSDDEFSD